MSRRRVGALILAGALVCFSAGVALATTWAPCKVKCPLCGTENKFMEVMSYGSYIYSWPSKYHYIFWPLTDRHVLYSCSKCRLSCFMGDFENLPKDKHEAVKKALEGAGFDKEYANYSDIPMTQRLRVAEKVYAAAGRDAEFWCRFYRVLAYHCDQEKAAGADEARKKAVEHAEKLLADEKRVGQRKELLLIRGAMRHFLKDDQAALADFQEAAKLTYRNKAINIEEPDADKEVDKYLSGLLADYTKLIEAGKPTPAGDPDKEADKVTDEFKKWLETRDKEKKDKP